MNYYQRIDLNSYEYFTQIFNNISIQKEEDLLKCFYIKNNNMNYSQNLITVNKSNINNNNTLGGTLKKNRTNLSLGNFSQYKNDFEKVLIKLPEKIYQKSPIRSIKKEKLNKINKIEIPYIMTPSDKKYTLVLDLNKTLAFYNKYTNNVSLRNGLFSFLSMMKPYYELISFSCEPNEITESIIKDIESQKIYFDYHLTREHSILYENTLVKDISLIGRDASKIIVIDDDENCFKLNTENGIRISEYVGNNEFDTALFELKKILLLIYKKNYDDIRIGIKEFSNKIRNKVSFV
jgi:TFIIF-interacting CTD phosphatase-like protein